MKDRKVNQDISQIKKRQLEFHHIPDLIERGFTLEEVGDSFGLSRERIRQIYAEHFGKVTTDSRNLNSFDRENVKGDIDIHCLVCGKKERKLLRARKGLGFYYCSKECFNKFHYREGKPIKCLVCTEYFIPFRSRNSMGFKKFMCSNECRMKMLAGVNIMKGIRSRLNIKKKI